MKKSLFLTFLLFTTLSFCENIDTEAPVKSSNIPLTSSNTVVDPTILSIEVIATSDEIKSIDKSSTPDNKAHLYVGGYGGYGVLDGGYSQDGQYAQYRFTMGVDAFRYKGFALGLEGGVQSGNSMRIKMNQTLVDLAGGLPPQAILKPFLDFLVVGRWTFVDKFQLLLKGGFAYRQLQFVDRTSPKDSLRRINGEFQGGLGYQLTPHTRIVALYQGIYSKSNLGITLDKNSDVLMHHIPTQQAGLFGIEYSF